MQFNLKSTNVKEHRGINNIYFQRIWGHFHRKIDFQAKFKGLVRPFYVKQRTRVLEAEGTIHAHKGMKVQEVSEAFKQQSIVI